MGDKSSASALRFDQQYPVGTLFTILGILACCIANGILTQSLLADGAVEMNPVMAYIIPLGMVSFLAIKYSITAVCVMVLVLLRNRRLFGDQLMVSDLLPFVQMLYIVLLIYEAFLLMEPHPPMA